MNTGELPGEQLDMEKMPGHWALARLGKRVLRPGGLAMTRRLLSSLAITSSDRVIEFAPGLGLTARMTLQANPASYTAVERDKQAAALVERSLSGPASRCVVGSAAETGLGDEAATVVYGEAMLTMQTLDQKRRIVGEASRLLASGIELWIGSFLVGLVCALPSYVISRWLITAYRRRVPRPRFRRKRSRRSKTAQPLPGARPQLRKPPA